MNKNINIHLKPTKGQLLLAALKRKPFLSYKEVWLSQQWEP